MMITKFIIGELLFLANSRPPFYWRDEFYQIKKKILTLYGTWDGVHLQHIVKWCYACNGTGKRTVELLVFGEPMELQAGDCRKCNGTAKYSEIWVALDSYRLGRRSFHDPRCRYYFKDRIPEIQFDRTIEGYIRHAYPKYYLHEEAAYWLALIFDPDLFWKHIGRTGYSSAKFTPMVIISTWIFRARDLGDDLRSWVRSIKRKITAFRRAHCRHDFDRSPEPRCIKCGDWLEEFPF